MTKGEKRRQKLLEIAYDLFLKKGYEETSIEDILAEAQIAKGTYYYYFQSKEQMLEEVIGMMISAETENAKKILDSPMSAPAKIVGIISALRPLETEAPIEQELHRPENYMLHQKAQRRLLGAIIPLLSKVVEQATDEGLFRCTNIPERVKILLIISIELFDDDSFTDNDIEVYIDIAEKILGAEKGTMDFIKQLINKER